MHRKWILVLTTLALLAASGASGQTETTLKLVKPSQLVQWEHPNPAAPWYANQAFDSELRSGVDAFFGNSVGAYFTNSADTASERFAEDGKWQLISSQFFPAAGVKFFFSRGRILDGSFTLYEYSDGSGPMSMFVTPPGQTNVVAAALVHGDCPPIAARDLSDAAAVKEHFDAPSCDRPAVSIFFKNRARRNDQIRDVLLNVGVFPLLRRCKHDSLHNPNTEMHKDWLAKHGSIPRCRVPFHVVFVDNRLR